MAHNSNVIRFPVAALRTATIGSDGISPVLIAEGKVMARMQLRRIADLAYDGLLNDREHESLSLIEALFSGDAMA
jgi:hypothetical protein